jgi:nucleoid-associated protein YgaU
MVQYTVVAGDTLRRIAQRFYGDESQWPRIFEANRDQISDPDQISVGWVLRIPGFILYTVVTGDTLRRIADRFYGDESQWPRIHNANLDQVPNPDQIFPGQELRIPMTAQYTVVTGDTLRKIAQRFYGDESQWPRIHDANRDQIPNPNEIFPGQVLNIP